MISSYINDWLSVIEDMQNDNTYKLAFGRALIECVYNDLYVEKDNKVCVHFDDISKCMLKYYWNQIFYFNLKQSPYKDKEPVICQDAKKLIAFYVDITKSSIPQWYDVAIEKVINKDYDYFNSIVSHVSKTLHENVCWRFKMISGNEIDLYEYNKGVPWIVLDKKNAQELKEFCIIISKLLNYKWTQLLEKFNFAPKIASKVNGISQAQLRRNNLKKYKDALIKALGGQAIDFYTGKVLSPDDISVDHVIPWSFMYSDDIWNMVLTSKSNNSSKNNTIPSEEVIARLKERNKIYLTAFEGKFKDDIELSIQNNYIDRFYYECRI